MTKLERTLATLSMAFCVTACGARTGLNVPENSFDAADVMDVGTEHDDGTVPDDGPRIPVMPGPSTVDCSLRANCVHAACQGTAICEEWVPGGCPVGQVHDPATNLCRPCEATDCDGLPSFCCISPVCANAAACGLFVCAPIARRCMGLTSTDCGVYDIDTDDGWGDCDEAVADVCCSCHVALGCADSLCSEGSYVYHNDCAPCTSADCDEVSCMGLNGCPTRCRRGQFFDGAHCRNCSSADPTFIPACH